MKKTLFLLALSLFPIVGSYSQKTLSTDYTYAVSAPYKVFDASQKVYFSRNNQSIAIKFDEKSVNSKIRFR